MRAWSVPKIFDIVEGTNGLMGWDTQDILDGAGTASTGGTRVWWVGSRGGHGDPQIKKWLSAPANMIIWLYISTFYKSKKALGLKLPVEIAQIHIQLHEPPL